MREYQFLVRLVVVLQQWTRLVAAVPRWILLVAVVQRRTHLVVALQKQVHLVAVVQSQAHLVADPVKLMVWDLLLFYLRYIFFLMFSFLDCIFYR